jgi:hypothetical protein
MQNLTPRAPRIGLCADCLHSRQMESAKGSVFYRC